MSVGGRGSRQRLTVYGATEAEAERKLTDERLRAERGAPPDAARQTVAQYLHWWLHTDLAGQVARGDIAAGTWRYYEGRARLYITPEVGEVPLRKLAPQHVAHLLAAPRLAHLGQRSRFQVYATLRAALSRAERLDLVDRNPADRVEPPKVRRERVRALTEAEARAILDAVSGHRLESLVRVGLSTGLRPGEIGGLDWNDVDLESGTLHVRWTLTRGHEAVDAQPYGRQGSRRGRKPVKTEGSAAPVPLTSTLVDVLRRHRVAQAEERLASQRWREPPWPLVWAGPEGGPIVPSELSEWVGDVCEAAGVRRMTAHELLRHGAATLLVAQGVEMRVISEILRHTSASTTSDIYAHVDREVAREAVGRLDGMLGGH
ncbi:site-specific integrase [Egibacter rhizosphaerae]|uniref:Site-specific integrase n=1 Tax=Egibacter rhizosphaerae TaxID=1670831 RepID=A0A411YE08_9ACTN|nr:site-specific integrase [Egibacter rhizosphaerae]QBI19382.1 site-specific integrase [Egibacter rhizosphaerae]